MNKAFVWIILWENQMCLLNNFIFESSLNLNI